jgi:hypothetical protein
MGLKNRNLKPDVVALCPPRLRQEDCEFEVSLGYIVTTYLKKKRRQEKEENHC